MADLLTLDELLTTTRSVRKRLDFSQSVPRRMIEECIAAAQQAPSGGNLQTWGFVVVTEPQKRTALADLYRKGYETFLSTPIAEAMGYGNPHASADQLRILSSKLIASLQGDWVNASIVCPGNCKGVPPSCTHARERELFNLKTQ